MKIKLAFGKEGLWAELPDQNTTVVEPIYVPALADEEAALRAALREPIGTPSLRSLVKPSNSVAVVFSDLTRPQPRRAMLRALLGEIEHVPAERITLINALGLHRPNTADELIDMVGEEIVAGYRIVQHDARDDRNLVRVGRTSFGRDVAVNAVYQRADVRILTGFIEPHFFAGFSGGPKAVLPGIAGRNTIMMNHNAHMIGSPEARWGITTGNPIWEEMREAALLTKPTFLFNTAINRDKQITGVFAGDLLQAHAAGSKAVGAAAMRPVKQLFDIVITTNSGFPLDLNLYQAVKGMSAAAQVVKPGGSIIVAAECRDGVPDGSDYERLLLASTSHEELLTSLRQPGFLQEDQWQAQIHATIAQKTDIYVKSSYLSPTTLARLKLNVCRSIEETVAQLLQQYGSEASICVLPEGPMTIPYVLKA